MAAPKSNHLSTTVSNKHALNRHLKCNRAGNMFQTCRPANDLSPSRVLVHGMTHMSVSDDHKWQLTLSCRLHSSDRYGSAWLCNVRNV